MIDHRGLLSSDPFTKGLEHTASGAEGKETAALLFVLREKIIALLRSASQGSQRSTLGSKTRKHLASRITFQNWETTCPFLL